MAVSTRSCRRAPASTCSWPAQLAAGVITAAEAAAVIAARDLTAKVIRVDDFAQDLGASEIKPVPGRFARRPRRRR